jgi:hypothetical protein
MRQAGQRQKATGSRLHLQLVEPEAPLTHSQLGERLIDAVVRRQWEGSPELAREWLSRRLPVEVHSAWENRDTISRASGAPFNMWFDAYRQLPADEHPKAEANLCRVVHSPDDIDGRFDTDARFLAGQYFAHLAQLGSGPKGREGTSVETTDWYAFTAVKTLEQLAFSDGRSDALADLIEAQVTQLENYIHHGKCKTDRDVARLTENPLVTAQRAIELGRPDAKQHLALVETRLSLNPTTQAAGAPSFHR